MTTQTNSTKTTKARGKTIYRACTCGETAHDRDCARDEDGSWVHFYRCRNCGSRIAIVRPGAVAA